ncbi:MAG TPA: phosphate ABC transporter ATP-binding protein [Symbiobacteriaceae bacterium]|nr:phosphate ABC transporter ATP-binding protein [Symbiobacteriaceae bacterium]
MKLRIEQLTVDYGGNPVLHGVSLAIPDRQVTALIGPSGCGKSTLLRALNRMHDLYPQIRVGGRVLLDGRDVRRLAPEELRARVGMVFQRPNPFPMSIWANVAFGPSLFGLAGRELDHLVERSLQGASLWSEVKDRLDQDARGLSGGQQQRLCIARALALEPEVLLMDEPSSALDPGSTRAIEELILALKERLAIVLVTHSMAQAGRVADHLALFVGGRLMEEGRPHEVLGRPRTEAARQFLTHAT